MAEDADRDALFGGAQPVADAASNPFAEDSSAGNASASGPGGGHSAQGSHAAPLESDEDAQHAALVQGGMAKPVAEAAAEPGAAGAAEDDFGDGDMVETDVSGRRHMCLRRQGGMGRPFHAHSLLLTSITSISPPLTLTWGKWTVRGARRAGSKFRAHYAAHHACCTTEDLVKFQADPVVREALDSGVDLKAYSQQMTRDLHAVEEDAIAAYVRSADGVAALHGDMCRVEGVLGELQAMLEQFQSKLGGISSEIKTLQDDSLAMNVQLKNRRAVRGHLGAFLDKVAVSEELVAAICDAPVDEAWCEDLKALAAKLAHHAGSDRSSTPGRGGHEGEEEKPQPMLLPAADTLAGRDALPQLQALRVKAVERAREWLLGQIAGLRQGQTNLQKQQEYVLLRQQYLFAFLAQHAPDVALEVTVAYEESMGRTLASTFKTYSAALLKMHVDVAGKSDVVGAELGGLGGFFSSRPDPRKRVDVFALRGRDSILAEPEGGKLEVHVESAASRRWPFEVLWRSLQLHLMDVGSVEFAFCSSFFGEARGSTVFAKVMSKPVSCVLEVLENYLFDCHDVVAMLIMLLCTQQHQAVMQGRGLACLDSFFHRVLMLLWPRLKLVLANNFKSLVDVDEGNIGPADIMKPHYISARYAEFSASVLRLHRSLQAVGMSDGMLVSQLRSSITTMERLLQSFAAAKVKAPLERSVLLVNNVKEWVRVAHLRRCSPDDIGVLEDRLAAHTSTFSEQLLSSHFGHLVNFVKSTTDAMHATAASADQPVELDSNGLPEGVQPTISLPDAEALVNGFASGWRGGIAALNNAVSRYFGDGEHSRGVLKRVLTSLLTYYTRFLAMLNAAVAPSTPFMRNVVVVPLIFAEIKKYSRVAPAGSAAASSGAALASGGSGGGGAQAGGGEQGGGAFAIGDEGEGAEASVFAAASATGSG